MKHNRMLIIAIVLLVLGIGYGAAAQENSTVTPAGTAVNVRSGPGLKYLLRGVLPVRGSLVATGRNEFDSGRACAGNRTDLDMWLRVQFYELEGWVNRCVVKFVGDVAALPVVEASNPAEERDRVTGRFFYSRPPSPPDGSLAGIYTRAIVVLRTEPSIESQAKQIISGSVEVYVIGRSEGNGWAQVQYRNQTGWIAAYLLSLPKGWERAVPIVD